MQLSNFRIASKLVAAFIVVAPARCGTGRLCDLQHEAIDDADTLLYERELIGLSLFKEANVERLTAVVALRDAMLATGLADRTGALKRVQDGRDKSNSLVEQATPLFTSSEGKQQLEKLRDAAGKDKQKVDALLSR